MSLSDHINHVPEGSTYADSLNWIAANIDIEYDGDGKGELMNIVPLLNKKGKWLFSVNTVHEFYFMGERLVSVSPCPQVDRTESMASTIKIANEWAVYTKYANLTFLLWLNRKTYIKYRDLSEEDKMELALTWENL